MGNDCFSLIRCFYSMLSGWGWNICHSCLGLVCGCKGTDFSENMQYLEMMILFFLKVHTKQKPVIRMQLLWCVLMTGLFLFLFLFLWNRILTVFQEWTCRTDKATVWSHDYRWECHEGYGDGYDHPWCWLEYKGWEGLIINPVEPYTRP